MRGQACRGRACALPPCLQQRPCGTTLALRIAALRAWHHHPLLLGPDGEKLAKRRGSPALSERREAGEDGRVLAGQLRMQLLSLGT